MRYWLIAAALIILLLGDVATTVIFTGAGIPESNPAIAPIAGSVVDQLVYKAPYAAGLLFMILVGVSWCEKRLPGTGIFVCGPVLILYALPVVHNCLVLNEFVFL